MTKTCLCNSNKNYVDCCHPFLHYELDAPTALALMRSRYSAYIEKNIEYLLATWHNSINIPKYYNNIKNSCEHFQWTKLIIIDPGKNSSFVEYDEVEFIAKYINKTTSISGMLYERSHFKKIEGKWYYIDGTYPAIKRNNVCPCGSTKKYKNCCGS